jgi:transcriptional regulator with XRE-family HTH domain
MSESTNKYAAMFKRLRSRDGYWKSYLITSFTNDLGRILKQSGISYAALARKLNVSPPYISKALRGGENFSVETMVKLASAADAVVHIHIARKGVAVRWTELPAESEDAPVTATPSMRSMTIHPGLITAAPRSPVEVYAS